MNLCTHLPTRWSVIALILLGLGACSGADDETPTPDTGGDGNSMSNGEFELASIAPLALQEGSTNGVNIPIVLTRKNGHNKNVSLNIEGATAQDNRLITFTNKPLELTGTQTTGEINVSLAIDDLPIKAQQRTFFITAVDGEDSARIAVEINITPTDAPDVYLLIGQSNMVGFSGDGTKLAQAGGPDEPNPRIFKLNVTKNDADTVFTSEETFTSKSSNVIVSDPVVQAEDPLHIPVDPSNTSGKDRSYIGMGMSFAKAALANTEASIVLVPAAWSGTSFCVNNDAPTAHWNTQDTDDDPNFGNTLLFDRAVTRANIALEETNGILRGILWHQGESDANDRCAPKYEANLTSLAKELRLQINPDRRGTDLRSAEANIPFVLGTMSRGIDDRADLSVFFDEKQIIDNAHKTLPSIISHAAVIINDDLTPANGFDCGNTSCIHFGAAAFRVMGARYYESLLRAVATP